MTPEQVRLVQQSWRKMVPLASHAAEMFYFRLFSLDPSLKAMFKGNLEMQGLKLIAMLNTAVYGLSWPERLAAATRQLGARHIGYGVQPGHYETVGEALMWTLEKGLGEGFTPEVKKAWESAYGLLASTMQEAGADLAVQ